MKKLSKETLENYDYNKYAHNKRHSKQAEKKFWKYVFDENGFVGDPTPSTQNEFWVGNKCHILSGIIERRPELSGIGLEGNAIDKEAFEFLADNTNVEWSLSLSTNTGNGFLYTSHIKNELYPEESLQKGYNIYSHSHGNTIYGTGEKEKVINAYNLPSESDLYLLKSGKIAEYNYSGFYIYNKANKDKKYHEWNKNTESMEDYAERNRLNIE